MVTTEIDRSVVCALNADVVNYSRMLADDFDATSHAMTVARQVVEKAVSERNGTLVNFVGDNFMAAFDSAVDGIQAAVDITTALEAEKIMVAGTQFRFRMGMDRGPVGVVDGRWEGDALNVAARIQALARAGGLSVSQTVYKELDEPALRLRSVGPQRLKNIPEPVEVFEMTDLPTERDQFAEGGLRMETPTVAVLPIHVEDVEDNVRSAASMLRADMIHRLAAIPGLVVIDAKTAEPSEVGARSARYVLDSGVHQVGDQIRVYVSLLDVTTMNVVKSHKFDAIIDTFLTHSDQLVVDVGHTFEVELVMGMPAGVYSELNDPVAIEKVYLGWYHLRAGTKDGWERSLELFDEVAAAHPELATGAALLAFAYWMGITSGFVDDPEVALAQAYDQAVIGVETGDPTGLAGTVKGAVLLSMGKVDEAAEAMKDLDIVRPTCDVTFAVEGSVKRYLGEWEEAIDLLDVAMRLTGVNNPWYPTVKACSLYVGHRNDQAASMAESVLEYQPNNVEALLVLAAAQVELGLERRAAATAASFRDAHPNLDVEAWLELNPYRDPSVLERWKADLASVGLLPARREDAASPGDSSE